MNRKFNIYTALAFMANAVEEKSEVSYLRNISQGFISNTLHWYTMPTQWGTGKIIHNFTEFTKNILLSYQGTSHPFRDQPESNLTIRFDFDRDEIFKINAVIFPVICNILCEFRYEIIYGIKFATVFYKIVGQDLMITFSAKKNLEDEYTMFISHRNPDYYQEIKDVLDNKKREDTSAFLLPLADVNNHQKQHLELFEKNPEAFHGRKPNHTFISFENKEDCLIFTIKNAFD